jgi:hypothetical protein
MRISSLRLDIDSPIVEFALTNEWPSQFSNGRIRKSGIRLCVPLHGSAHAISLFLIQVITHANFFSVPKHWSPRDRKD